MQKRYFLAVVAAFFGYAAHAQQAAFQFSYHWDNPEIGGVSGLEISEDGTEFWAVTDKGQFLNGIFARGETDEIIDVSLAVNTPIMFFAKGELLNEPHSDAEGIARTEDGRLFVSFEQITRIRGLSLENYGTTWIPNAPDFGDLAANSTLEALAVDQRGAVYSIPERSGRLKRPFPVFRVLDGVWDSPFSLPRRDGFLPVGADFGPDQKLYVLEREFLGIQGFRSRVRAFTIKEDEIVDESVMFETDDWTHDNLEGLSVWTDEQGGIRLTMVSDDNFNPFQRTEIVEYRIQQ